RILLDSLVQSLRTIVITRPLKATEWLSMLRDSSSSACRRIHAAVLCGSAPELAPAAACYLAMGGKALSIYYKGKPAACTILAVHSHRFSVGELAQIE